MSWIYVPGTTVSLSEFDSLPQKLEQSVWWRGKPSPLRTWFARWKRGGWILRLSGLTLRPSMAGSGVRRLILSLRVSRVSRSAPLDQDSAQATLAGYGPASRGSSKSASPPVSSSKTCPVSSVEDCIRSSKTLQNSGSMRSGVCSLRRTSGHRTSASGSSCLLPTPTANAYGTRNNGNPHDNRTEYATKGSPSLDTMARQGCWPTPTVGDSKNSGSRNLPTSCAKPGVSLTDAVKYGNSSTPRWPTPQALDGIKAPKKFARGNPSLPSAVKLWPTPAARDYRHPNAKPYSERGGESQGEQLPNAVGGSLNPDWVEWLMGLPIGWTGSGPSATEWSRWQSLMRSSLYDLGYDQRS